MATFAFLLISALLMVGTGTARRRKGNRNEPLTQPPNIVILFADDLGYGDLQMYGHPTSSTPNLNRLAAGGLVFTQFYSAAAICSPSRAALLTGRYHMRSGIYPGVFNVTSSGGLPHSETTIAEMLKSRGYYTAMVGKWHLGVGENGRFLPPSHGFDEFLGLPASHSHCPCSVCFYPNISCAYTCKPNFSPCPLYNGTTIIEQPIDLMTLDQKYATRARQAIRTSVQAGKPFFLYYSFQHTHDPPYADWRHTGTTARGPFGDALAAMDWEIGETIAELEENGLLNNTFVFFTADNGPSLSKRWGGSVGLLKCGKATTYEGGVRVPAIAHWTGRITPGYTLELSSTLDLLPTIATISGAQLPDVTLDGVDMAPFLFNGQSSSRETFFYYPPAVNENIRSFAVRYHQYKAHFYTKGSTLSGQGNPDPDCRKMAKRTKHNPPLLYDLHRDPAEQYNIAGEPQYQDVIKQIIHIREDFESRMTWAESEIHKPYLTEYMPCCNPGCHPFPYCCHCTTNSSLAYDPMALYADIWAEREREGKGYRRDKLRQKLDFFKDRNNKRRDKTSFFKEPRRGRVNNRDIFEDNVRINNRDNIGDNTMFGNGENIRGNTRGNGRDNTRNNPRDNTRDSAGENIRDRTRENPRDKTRDKTRDGTRDGVRDNGRDKSRDQTMDSTRDNSRENIRGNAGEKTRDRTRTNSRDNEREIPWEIPRNNDRVSDSDSIRGSARDSARDILRDNTRGNARDIVRDSPRESTRGNDRVNDRVNDRDSPRGFTGDSSGDNVMDNTRGNARDTSQDIFTDITVDTARDIVRESTLKGFDWDIVKDITRGLARDTVRENNRDTTRDNNRDKTRDATILSDGTRDKVRNQERRRERQNMREMRRLQFGIGQDEETLFL